MKKQRILALALICFAVGFNILAMAQETGRQPVSAKQQLNAHIPKVDASWLQTANKVWDNPEVFVDVDGIYLTTGIPSTTNQKQRVANLTQALLQLPVSDWPHGRVIRLVQSSRIPIAFAGQPEPGDTGYQLLKRSEKELKELGIEVVMAPI